LRLGAELSLLRIDANGNNAGFNEYFKTLSDRVESLFGS
jgi:hypothetical protein